MEREWPLSRARGTVYYLRSGGGLSPELPARDEAPAGFAFDPEHPVPTITGNVAGYYELVPMGDLDASYVRPRARMRNIVAIGAAHQKEEPGIVGARPPYPLLSERPDVLVFQTPPLGEDVEVTGPVSVRLWVSSTAVDTDFTAKLLDVHPPSEEYPVGYHMNLTDSIVRARYRESRERAVLMEPGLRLRSADRAVPDKQPVQGRAPDTPGRVELELPSIRRQPEHGRADGASHAHGSRSKQRTSRPGPCVPRRAAGGALSPARAYFQPRPPSRLGVRETRWPSMHL